VSLEGECERDGKHARARERLACIDIGTNSVVLLIAEATLNGCGDFRALWEESTVTRLGAGVDKTRQLSKAALERTAACLNAYARKAGDLEVAQFVVVATSAVRDAGGSADLAQLVHAIFGVAIRVLSGVEEARNSAAGARIGVGTESLPAPHLIFDLGGGSTEIIHMVSTLGPNLSARDEADVKFSVSLDVGCVRMSERFLSNDPPSASDISYLREAVQRELCTVPAFPADSILGVAGTVTTLAAMHLKLREYDGKRVHGLRLERRQVQAICTEIASMTQIERMTVVGLPTNRADVIVAGMVIVDAIMGYFSCETLVVSDRGLRWGIANAFFARKTGAPPSSDG
jgi:exopolyphosphatase / guanosine-5'-triphosphate,3'-diphosphate pyrophosphatase